MKLKLQFGLVENKCISNFNAFIFDALFIVIVFFLVSHINALRKNYFHMLHSIFCTLKFYIICSSNVARYQYTMFPRHLITAHHLIEFIYTTLTLNMRYQYNVENINV